MTVTLLLDLDNTLLDNKTEDFMPAYLGALSQRMAPFVNPSLMLKTLLAATSEMMQNNDPDLTLMQVFDAAFYPKLGLEKAAIWPTLQAFYAEDFPKVKRVTKPVPEAIRLVEKAFAQGYRVGIATNPIFPRSAILQRLEWAGLPASQYPFDLIPDYESFHFSKPNPAFYAEFLAQMGWPEGPVVMVGDEVDLDIKSAREFGLPAFWITSDGTAAWPGPDAEPAHGSIKDVFTWVETLPGDAFPPDQKSPAAVLHSLNGIPAALLTLCAGLSKEQWTQQPARGEWGAVEIICHLRDVEGEVNLPRLRMAQQVKNPFIPAQDTGAWAEDRKYIRQDGPQALLDFVRCRKETLSLLRGVRKEDWDLPTRHAIFGPTRLYELVGMITEHDRIHIQQFFRLNLTK